MEAKGPSLIPTRYIIATLFIAALLLLVAVVQAPRSSKAGGVTVPDTPTALTLDSFEVVADQEMGDDSLKDFNVTGQLSDYDRQNAEKFKASGKGSWITATLLNYLAAEGLLAKGTYLIRNT